MNYRMIVYLVCYILRIESICLLPALAISLFEGETNAAAAIALSMAIAFVCSFFTRLYPIRTKEISAKEGFLCVALTWIAVSLLGALPFYLSRAIPSFVDCFFETVSGFTTTGASILADVESLPKSLLYWRSFTHWLGGMGVLVFLLAVVPMGKERNSMLHIMQAESPGPQVDKLVPRMQESAKILYAIYIALTVIQIILLLLGGMPFFDSLCISFGSAGTGGFAIKNDSLASYSYYCQSVCTIFMALFGVNFSIFYLCLLRQFKKALKNQELRLYIFTMLAAIVLITINTLSFFNFDFVQTLHHVAFQVSSIMTTTGFSTVDFSLWPTFSRTLLLILMICGACAGSTGGGIKAARVLLLCKNIKHGVRRILNPRRITGVLVDDEPVDESIMQGTFTYLSLYALITIVSTLIIALDHFSLETNVSAVLACINNIGPGLDLVGPMSNYSIFSDPSKIVLSMNMLLGRLEIFPILMLFVPSAWKK